jgi:electron transfer flavoprotein alpha subunit
MQSTPPTVPNIPRHECILFSGSPQQIAAEFTAMLHHEHIFSTPQRGITVEQSAPIFEPPPLTEAQIIVAGGKGIAFPPDKRGTFAQRGQRGIETLINPLANSLGAATAASRALIDSANINPALQIGQSGRTVSPELYIAVGISGAVQHLQGIVNSRVIFAVNKDPDAPIFRYAHYGAVGDVYKILPALTQNA